MPHWLHHIVVLNGSKVQEGLLLDCLGGLLLGHIVWLELIEVVILVHTTSIAIVWSIGTSSCSKKRVPILSLMITLHLKMTFTAKYLC